ncbi:hypothetical protein BD413DRAFT_308027 [Trametes elegans]|nr:hypothetical protein BD413DRAFT_308027 [Trametes elegans]
MLCKWYLLTAIQACIRSSSSHRHVAVPSKPFLQFRHSALQPLEKHILNHSFSMRSLVPRWRKISICAAKLNVDLRPHGKAELDTRDQAILNCSIQVPFGFLQAVVEGAQMFRRCLALGQAPDDGADSPAEDTCNDAPNIEAQVRHDERRRVQSERYVRVVRQSLVAYCSWV